MNQLHTNNVLTCPFPSQQLPGAMNIYTLTLAPNSNGTEVIKYSAHSPSPRSHRQSPPRGRGASRSKLNLFGELMPSCFNDRNQLLFLLSSDLSVDKQIPVYQRIYVSPTPSTFLHLDLGKMRNQGRSWARIKDWQLEESNVKQT